MNVYLRAFFILSLLGLSTVAQAADGKPFVDSWHVTANTFTYHTHTHDHINNVNPGLGFMARHNNWLGAAGVYKNSYFKTTAYGVVGWQSVLSRWGEANSLRAGVVGGLASGYQDHNEIAPLFGAGVVSLQFANFGTHMIVIPPGDNKAPAAFSLMLSYQL